MTHSRRHLPDIRPSITKKGIHGGIEYYVTVGFYESTDDEDVEEAMRATPGEVFVKVAKQGSDLSIMVDGWAIMVSLALQMGCPWSKIMEKFTHYPYGNILQCITYSVDEAIKARKAIIGLDEAEMVLSGERESA